MMMIFIRSNVQRVANSSHSATPICLRVQHHKPRRGGPSYSPSSSPSSLSAFFLNHYHQLCHQYLHHRHHFHYLICCHFQKHPHQNHHLSWSASFPFQRFFCQKYLSLPLLMMMVHQLMMVQATPHSDFLSSASVTSGNKIFSLKKKTCSTRLW